MQEQVDDLQPGTCKSDEDCGAVYSCSMVENESDGVCKMVWWMILIIVILILIAVFSIIAFLCRCLTCGLCCGNWMNTVFCHTSDRSDNYEIGSKYFTFSLRLAIQFVKSFYQIQIFHFD